MRAEKDLTIDEIAERLAISRQTIFHWVRDLPMRRPRRASPGQRRGSTGIRLKFKQLRDVAYEEGWQAFDELILEPSFRDFVCMYIGYHADQDVDELRDFWARLLRIDPADIRLQRKSNSHQLTGRRWRFRWGVLSIGSNDTYFRARLQAWM